MATRTLWRRVPLNQIDQDLYGRTAAAYRHPAGFMLVHHKFFSRGSKLYHTHGMWMLVRKPSGDEVPELLLRQPYYYALRPRLKPPVPWANAALRRIYRVAPGDTRPLHEVVDGDTPPPDYTSDSYAVSPDEWEGSPRRQAGAGG